MEFIDKYVRIDEQELPENKDKIPISDDAFAIGEVIYILKKEIADLINKLEHLRVK